VRKYTVEMVVRQAVPKVYTSILRPVYKLGNIALQIAQYAQPDNMAVSIVLGYSATPDGGMDEGYAMS